MDKNKIVYELAFHLNPDLEESQIKQLSQNIEQNITSNGGVISFRKQPEKVRLSYPIKNKRIASFGYYYFNLEAPEKLTEIEEQVKLNNDVMRYLIVKVPIDSGKVKFRFKPAKPKAPEKQAEIQPPTDAKELEKQLEGVLENL